MARRPARIPVPLHSRHPAGFPKEIGYRLWEVFGKFGVARPVFLFAMLAEDADQPLGEHSFNGTGDQIRLDAHVDRGRAGTRSWASFVCSVLKTSSPIQRRLDCRFRGFSIADFTDQDDVGVVTQNASKTGGKRQADLGMHLDLADSRVLVYSTGSSTVMILIVGSLISFKALYSVDVFPLPVGPVTRMMPCGSAISS